MESEKDLIVDVSSTEVSIALMENHRLIELNKESSQGHSFSVGDVYLGKVKKILPALNAAFVDIGDEKQAFVHYLDLGLYFNAFDEFVKRINPNTDAKGMYKHIKPGPILEKEGRIENVLTPGQMIIVQIVKEPISTKAYMKLLIESTTSNIKLTRHHSTPGQNPIIDFTENYGL